jgi:hypothetical protein
MIANIASDDALILPHRANPAGLNFRERQAANSRILIPTLCAKWRHFALRKKIESFRRRSTVKDVADLPIGA